MMGTMHSRGQIHQLDFYLIVSYLDRKNSLKACCVVNEMLEKREASAQGINHM